MVLRRKSLATVTMMAAPLHWTEMAPFEALVGATGAAELAKGAVMLVLGLVKVVVGIIVVIIGAGFVGEFVILVIVVSI